MRTLAGKRIVITRSPHQSANIEHLLHERGAIPLLYPCIDITPLDDLTALDDFLRALAEGKFEWLLLTSSNAVLAIKQRLLALGLEPTDFRNLCVGAVGTGTAQAVAHSLGLAVSTIPEDYTAEALAKSLPQVEGMRILLPQSSVAGTEIIHTLSRCGALVTPIAAYNTTIGTGGINLNVSLNLNEVDAITFTSGSTVTNLLLRLEIEGGDRSLLSSLCLACIGTKTAAIARHYNLPVAVMPSEHTPFALVQALEDYYSEPRIKEPKL